MKSDIDALMEANDVEALLVTGPAQYNPDMVYLTGGGHITRADLIKKRGQKAVLFHGPMERDEAARTGLDTVSYNQYPMAEMLKQAGGDAVKAAALRYQRMIGDLGITSGKVFLYGQADIGPSYSTLKALQQLMPELNLTGDSAGAVLPLAMATKDANEIMRIRRMGQITTRVVAKTAELISSHPARGGVLVKEDNTPLTIGDVKARINLWLAESGAENPTGTIFAIGRDAGVPHSSGTSTDALRLGQTIVFDIYPCEAGGGYFYDFTRTWCLGYAPAEAQQLYEQVLSVYNQVTSELEVNAPLTDYQKRTCNIYESQGHATIQSNANTENGYVHSLSHGVGVRIHEKPWSGSTANATDILAPGSVFTIEPGLYYPERGMGMRLEDTWTVLPDGHMEKLVEYPMDLVLPVKHID
jgi:Xaa-Pro aminopeptidase